MNDLKRTALNLAWKERLELAQVLLESLHESDSGSQDIEIPTTNIPFQDPEAGHNLKTDLCSPPSLRKIDLNKPLPSNPVNEKSGLDDTLKNEFVEPSKKLSSDHEIAEGFAKLRDALGSSVEKT